MILYRPVGKKELALIVESNYSEFPSRLPEQPIFYPVLNRKYAEEIAEKWNTRDKNSGYKGYVTEFEVDDDYISRYEVQTVGASYHQELWIPAEELAEFNSHIKGKIKVIALLLSREEIIDLIKEITDVSDKTEEQIDGLLEKLQNGVLDPEISDYIFWSDMTPEEIADKVLNYKPILL